MFVLITFLCLHNFYFATNNIEVMEGCKKEGEAGEAGAKNTKIFFGNYSFSESMQKLTWTPKAGFASGGRIVNF